MKRILHLRIVFLLVLALCALSLALPVAAATKSCDYCGDLIRGRVVEAGDKYYHPLHVFCSHCEDHISGSFTVYRGANYHTRCFENYVAIRCSLCDGVVRGEYVLDFWGNGYHLEHQGQANACEYCGRFISKRVSDGGVRYSDGRMICGICKDTAIISANDARDLMDEVCAHLTAVGLTIDPSEVRLHIMGLEEMQRMSGRSSHNVTGYTDYLETRTGWGLSKKRDIDVYVLYGMPRMELISTLAHELTHVWQFLNGKMNNDQAFSEGSCNYAAYLVLQRYEGQESDYLITNLVNDPHPVYGEGFRRVRQYASAEGNDTWIKTLKRKRKLPKGY